MELLTPENIERQLTEMWQAIADNREGNPNHSDEIAVGNKVENELRSKYRKQEQLRNAAPLLLQSLQEICFILKSGATSHKEKVALMKSEIYQTALKNIEEATK